MSALDGFSPVTRQWFADAFAAPTPAQEGAWSSIARGDNTLVVAPTGSGKTLAAFLWAIDRLAIERSADPGEDGAAGRSKDGGMRLCRVVYVSPLKALAVDVERNLRAPLTGIRRTAARLGRPVPEISVAIRSGDTTAEERRRFAADPAEILITTPESLFLLLTSQARNALRGVETVIVDEVHAVAATKRGAHLALSLERLDALLPRPAQRIGLSATVRPVSEVAAFLGGPRPATVVQPPAEKTIEVEVVVPVEDMTELAPPAPGATGADAERPAEHRRSIWPHVEERLLDLIEAHRSTIVFANSRRLSERLCARLNELSWERRAGAAGVPSGGGPAGPGYGDAVAAAPSAPPAAIMAQAGTSGGVAPEIVRAHHGSVSKEERAQIEEALKSGRLPGVVATSSLELGIDMGMVDLVACVGSPPSVASGLQRIGRAGHQVGAVSRGVIFPKYRGDLIQTAVVAERMKNGQIEEIRYPRNPLDVLAQQIVAMTALDEWTVDSIEALVRRAAPYATLPRAALEATLDMLAGRYPSEEFAELRPRIVWDRVTGTLRGRPGAQRLAVTSGGTIPDRGLFGVFLAGDGDSGRRPTRVGELDEEMVYESRVGDVFVLGATSWRIEDITADRVLVSPAPGRPGKLPFWHGDSPGRPAELGRAVGAFLRELSMSPESAYDRIRAAGLDEFATGNLLSYLAEQREATGYVPDDRTLVVERFHDELGDWRVVIHSPYGARVHAPWALAIGRRLRERYGVEVQALHTDDGIVLQIPDTLDEAPTDVAVFDPEEIEQIVTEELGGSALFAARFRECAGRSLLLPRRGPGKRTPLWRQRQRAAHLLSVASRYASFPIVLETMRECLQDVFDVPGLVRLMRDAAARRVRVVEVETARPSPFAASLLFDYIGAFMYEGDAPLAERRAQALTLDTALLAELLGQAELRELLDPDVIAETERELARLDRPLRDVEDLADLLRSHGPLPAEDIVTREGDLAWAARLERERRAIRVRLAGHEQWAAVEDAWRLRDALGVPLPVGVPHGFLEPPGTGGPGPAGAPAGRLVPRGPDPLGDLVSRHARTRGPFSSEAAAARFGVGVAVIEDTLARLAATGRVIRGEFRPGGRGEEWCDAGVLRLLRRRSLARLRKEVEPVPPEVLAAFLPAWHGVTPILSAGGPAERHGPAQPGRTRTDPMRAGPASRGAAHSAGTARAMDDLVGAIERLQGAAVPASALETLVLPGRVPGYSPVLLDELTSSGEVLWVGQGSLPGGDGWVSLYFADTAPLLLPPPQEITLTPLHERILEVLGGGGALLFRELSDRVAAAPPAQTGAYGSGVPEDTVLAAALWDLVWSGRVTGDTLAPLRSVLGTGRPAHRAATVRRRRAVLPTRSGPPTVSGRWWRVPAPAPDDTRRAQAMAEVLLDRHGVLTRGGVAAERLPGGFSSVYQVLRAYEESGRCRRGYFVEGLGGAQFALPGAVDRMRAMAPSSSDAGNRTRPTDSNPPDADDRTHATAPNPPDADDRTHATAPNPPDADDRTHATAPNPPDADDRTHATAPNPPDADDRTHATASNPPGAVTGPMPPPVPVPGAGPYPPPVFTDTGPAERRVVVLAAADPANPYGAALPWPDRGGDVTHRPGRKAGALVVLVEGRLVLYVERGGKTLLSFVRPEPTGDGPDDLRPAVRALAAAVRHGALGKLTVERADGAAIADSPLAAALEEAGFHPTPRGLRIRA